MAEVVPRDNAVDPVAVGVMGVVLTGGHSRRMGRDKALIHIDGEALVDRIGNVLRDAGCVRVVAIGPPHLAGALEHVDDMYPGQGPLGGIITALAVSATATSLVCVVACDLVGLDIASVGELIGVARAEHAVELGADVVMAYTDRREPLCAIWNARCAPVLQTAFADGQRAIRGVLDSLSLVTVNLPCDAFRNVNSPDDLPSE